jgi:FkbM family methyltransferase
MEQPYAIPAAMLVPDDVQVILDCGANIGITSLFLVSRYRNARIYSIEPNPENFELLKSNTAPEPRILPIHGAIVGYPRKSVQLTTHQPAWGNYITAGGGGSKVAAITIEQICEANGLSSVDLLQLDIEGAEQERLQTEDLDDVVNLSHN